MRIEKILFNYNLQYNKCNSDTAEYKREICAEIQGEHTDEHQTKPKNSHNSPHNLTPLSNINTLYYIKKILSIPLED